MKLYKVIDKEGFAWTHPEADKAEAEKDRQEMLNDKRWSDYYAKLDLSVQESETDSLPMQHVTVYGDHIGYQFSRSKNGQRSMRRTVRDIALGADGRLTGTISVLGRTKVGVKRLALDIWWTVDPRP